MSMAAAERLVIQPQPPPHRMKKEIGKKFFKTEK
jgi:hypothetical protein